MTINDLRVEVHTKDGKVFVFPAVSDIETIGNRIEIKSSHDVGQITADLDLEKIDFIAIGDCKPIQSKENVDNEKPSA